MGPLVGEAPGSVKREVRLEVAGMEKKTIRMGALGPAKRAVRLGTAKGWGPAKASIAPGTGRIKPVEKRPVAEMKTAAEAVTVAKMV